jgi:hypothetical protein
MQAQTTGNGNFEWNQRWQHYLHRTYSWQRLAMLSADSAFDHLTGEPGEWGRDAGYFGARYGAALGRRIVRNSIELGAGAALGEDTRFRPSRATSFRSRLGYAFLQSVSATREEHRVFAWSRLAATVGGAALCSGWGGQRPLGPGRFMDGVAFGYLGHLQNSLLAEFAGDLKNFGRRVRKRILRAD